MSEDPRIRAERVSFYAVLCDVDGVMPCARSCALAEA